MGISVNLYCGPWVRFDIPITLRVIDACKSPSQCPNNPTASFCSVCGIIPESRYRREDRPAMNLQCPNDALTYLNRMGAMEEVVNGEKCEVRLFVPNEIRPGGPARKLHLDGDCSDVYIDLFTAERAWEIIWLKQEYSAEIKQMSEESWLSPSFGWGLLRCCS